MDWIWLMDHAGIALFWAIGIGIGLWLTVTLWSWLIDVIFDNARETRRQIIENLTAQKLLVAYINNKEEIDAYIKTNGLEHDSTPRRSAEEFRTKDEKVEA